MDLDQTVADTAEDLMIRRFRRLRATREPVVLAAVSCGRCGADQVIRVQKGMRRIAIVCTHCFESTMASVPSTSDW